jgi:hypothetical protein
MSKPHTITFTFRQLKSICCHNPKSYKSNVCEHRKNKVAFGYALCSKQDCPIIKQLTKTIKSEKPLIGYFSQKAKQHCGSVIYRTPDNKEIEVTAVFTSKYAANKMYKWEDKKYVGPVVKFIRKVNSNLDSHWTYASILNTKK